MTLLDRIQAAADRYRRVDPSWWWVLPEEYQEGGDDE